MLPFDTQLAEYVLLGNLAAGAKEMGMRPRSLSLDMSVRRRGGKIKDPVVDVMIKNGINPVRLPRSWLQGRAEQDVETTEELFLDQRKELVKRNLLPVLFTRVLLTPVLADIEPEGMALDAERVEATHRKYTERLAELEKELEKLVDGANWRSPKQMAGIIYDKLGFREVTDWRGKPKRTAKGQRKADAKTIDKLVADTAEQREFIRIRKEIGKVGAAISKNLDFFLGVVRERGGVFYASFNQSNTATHRLSSSGITLTFQTLKDEKGKPKKGTVQFQNMPRAFKKLFKAKREGWYMVDVDGAQLEFRVAAELGHDTQAFEDITNPEFDSHRFTASEIFGTTVEAVKAQEQEAFAKGIDSWRQQAKPDTFKPLYGGSKGTPEQERYYAAFKQRYRGIAQTQESWVEQVLQSVEAGGQGELITPWGLRYYWPIAKRPWKADGFVNVGSAVYNYPIQALATAEIIPIAIVYLWHKLPEFGLEDYVHLVNTVHDSAPCEVHPDHVEQFVLLAKQCFTHDVYHYLEVVYGMDFAIPLGVGIKVAEHWGDTKDEQAFDIYKDGREVKRK
jgi:DNA polymerase-1